MTSAKVKDGSLLAADFKTGQVPAGPQGVQGIPGIMALKTVDGAILSLAPGGFGAPPMPNARRECTSSGQDSTAHSTT